MTDLAAKLDAVRFPQKFEEPVEFSQPLTMSVESGITAGTTQTQAGAYVLSKSHSIIETVAVADDGVSLPVARIIGQLVTVENLALLPAQIWPHLLGTISGGSVAGVDAIKLQVGEKRTYRATSVLNWAIHDIKVAQLGELSEIVAATNVITAAENGKTFYLNLVGGFTSTLPVPALGLKFRFVVKIAPTTAYIILTNAVANIVHGSIGTSETPTTAVTVAAAADTVNFVANKAVIGDWCEFESDGVNWYLMGMCFVQDGMTSVQAG